MQQLSAAIGTDRTRLYDARQANRKSRTDTWHPARPAILTAHACNGTKTRRPPLYMTRLTMLGRHCSSGKLAPDPRAKNAIRSSGAHAQFGQNLYGGTSGWPATKRDRQTTRKHAILNGETERHRADWATTSCQLHSYTCTV